MVLARPTLEPCSGAKKKLQRIHTFETNREHRSWHQGQAYRFDPKPMDRINQVMRRELWGTPWCRTQK